MSTTTTTATMKAMALDFKSDKAHVVEMPKPTPDSNQILVKVQLSALDTAVKSVVDKTWTGTFIHSKTNPLVLGWHYYGAVEQVGADVSTIRTDDTVWGFLQYEPSQNQGAFAEYIVVNEEDCAKTPSSVSTEVIAASSTEALTALQAMRDLGGLSANKSILIVGAGGGVGSAAVGIAKKLGAQVTAVVSTKDVERVKKLGADVVIDRTQVDDPLMHANENYDVIFDAAVAYSSWRSLKKVKRNGTYVAPIPSWGLLAGMLIAPFYRKSVKFVGCHSNAKDLELVGQWLQDGLEIEVDSKYKVKDLEAAIVRQNTRSKVGRVVIQVERGWN